MHRTIIAILLISLIPISVDAQTPSPEVNWTAGWEIEDDVALMQLDSLSYNFELTLNFWINNNRLTPIEVGFETSFENVSGLKLALPKDSSTINFFDFYFFIFAICIQIIMNGLLTSLYSVIIIDNHISIRRHFFIKR